MAVVGQAAGGRSWAKVRLTRGQSAGGVWEIDAQYPQARLAIGSDPSAGWSVVGAGVRPVHFELYWDGRCLFVADTQRAGGVTLNGMAVGGDWLQVRGRGEVTFGQAAMAIETSDGTATALPDPASARRISAAEGPSKQHNLAELTGEATRMTDSPFDGPPSLTGEATRIQDSPLDAALAPPMLGGAGRPPPPPPPGQARPRLGGDPQPPAQAGQAKTLMHDELAGAVGEATRMVAMPDTPGAPYGAPGGGMAPPMMAPAAPLADPTGPPAAPFGAPAGAPPPATGGFAAPPGYGEGGPPKKSGGTPFGLPPRTLALAAALILGLVVIGFVGFGDEEEYEYDDTGTVAAPATDAPPPTAPVPTAAPPPTTPTTTSQIQPLASGVPATAIAPIPTTVPAATGVPATAVPPTAVPPVTGVAPVPVPTTVVVPPGPTTVPPVPTAVPPTTVSPTAPPSTGVVDPAVPVGPTPERLAADRVLAGRYDEALPLYQALAAQHPERPEYSAMVRILEGRLRAQCVNGVGPDGRPCAVP